MTASRLRQYRQHTVPLAVALAMVSSGARSQTLPKSSDDGRAASDAQPGLYRVAIARAVSPTLSASLGYGYTESQGFQDRAHHRFSTLLAAAASVTPWLNLGAMATARYDRHSNDSGTIVDGALVARPGVRLGHGWLGAEFKTWLPGAEKLTLSATSLDARALYAQSFGFGTLAAYAGYRLDNSSRAGTSAPRLSQPDRLALGLSDFDAMLLGLGALVPMGSTQWLAEISGDVLVGNAAPQFTHSPLRVTTGLRQLITDRLSLDALADVSLSGRPAVSSTAPLVPVEPRLSVWFGIRYRFSNPQEPASPIVSTRAVETKAPEPPKQAMPAQVPETSLEVVVLDDQGNPVENAKITVNIASAPIDLIHTQAGHYRADHVPAGEGELTIFAEGSEPVKQKVSVKDGTPLSSIPVQLKALPPPSQVRGVVRSFGGKVVTAKIHVDPLGVDTETDATGAFQLDVSPGDYEVIIEAQGYTTQRRKVHVDPQGVVILNADLVKKR